MRCPALAMVKNRGMDLSSSAPVEPIEPGPVLLHAECPRVRYPGRELFAQLRFDIRPGLTLVLGGDGSGKTTLLRLMAGEMRPSSGTIERRGAARESVFWVDLRDERFDQRVTDEWLQEQQRRFATWDQELASALLDAFGLAEHRGKCLYMLSTGTRRKVGLIAAFASGALLTLMDMPYAALDSSSRGLLDELLGEAARQDARAFVVADATVPTMEVERLATVVDLEG